MRVGIVGAGWWATQHHIPSLLGYPDAEVVGVADLDPGRREAVRKAFGIENVFASHSEMLERAKPDGVVVAVQHAYHHQVARDALSSGVGVMLEKPMTLRAAQAWELVELARVKGVPLTVGYPFNYTAHARAARDAIRSGEIGEMQLVSGLFASMVVEYLRGNPEAYRTVFKFPVTGPGASTYSDPRVAGGGQGHLQVTHLAGLLLWITGLRASEVFAYMNNEDLQVDLIDAISLRFEQGALGVFGSTGNVAVGSPETLEGRIYGSRGSLRIDPHAGTLSIASNGAEVKTFPPLPAEARYPAEATSRNLVDLLKGHGSAGASTCGPGELGARVVELLEAAYLAAASAAPVAISRL